MNLIRASVFLVIGLIVSAAQAAEPASGPVEFTRDIQPILADKCFLCHGPDAGTRKGDLRLDVLDPKLGPFVPRDGYSIIAPGKLDDSVLIMRITSDDADVHMPPPKSNRTLSDKQIDLLKRWVEQGAKWQKHWSLVPPVRPSIPAVKKPSWSRNAIDRFVLARMEKEGLEPSPEADRRTLIRRVTLDLTGLPPTPEEVDAFLNDKSADAYERVVDRLLASQRFGERMAWDWLDVARYADTNGYQNDPTRTMWPWRDWVINAFNENLAYDQFVTWQLAGDLIPDATQAQRLASGFNRNHGYNAEGGRIPEETRVENVMDRVDTTATAFIGLTIGCAKCHDHKYDPISQKEYYQLFAYFNQCSEDGRGRYANLGNVPPVMPIASIADKTKLAALRLAATTAEGMLNAAMPLIDAKQKEWEESARYAKGWIVATPLSTKSTGGASMQTLADSSVLVSGKNPASDVHEIVLKTDLRRVNGFRLEALPDPSLPKGGPGRSEDSGNFVLTGIEASAVSAENPSESKPIKIDSADATFEQAGGFNVAKAIDGDPKTGWAILGAPDRKAAAVFRFADSVGFAGGTEIHLTLHYEALNQQHSLGRFRIALTDGPTLTPAAAEALAIEPEHRSDAQKNLLRDFYRAHVSPQYKSLNAAVVSAKKSADDFDNQLTKVMVMDDATPRDTHVLVKGAYDKPLDKVEAGVPHVLNPLPQASKNNRLALSKWMFAPENPLVSRVIVNRYWQQFFGVGIVKTVDDFGAQGERPVNPELLDWLAVQFRESGWDTKAMLRLIVTSSTYRQSSKVSRELLEKDPENRFVARGPRLRLSAPAIRDQALFVAGLMSNQIGGAPAKPYQPPGIWEEATFGFIKYEQDHGEGLYRRSLYTFWRRIVGPTEFFDAGTRTVCTVRQSRTNTPLHALTTLNDTTYVEAARNLAQRIMQRTDGGSPQSRIQTIYRLVLSRDPDPKEEAVLMKALTRLTGEYAADKDSAMKLLSVGESKRDEKLDRTDHAAWTALCLEMLNLDEALTKE